MSDHNYTDGRYPSIKAPQNDYWDDDDFFDDDDDEASWAEPIPLPPRVTHKRSTANREQTVQYETASRDWRREERSAGQRRRLQQESDAAERTGGLQMPVFTMLVITILVFTVLGGLGRRHGYRDLDYDWRTSPLLSLVFDGWHSHIDPIDALTKDPETPQILQELAASQEESADASSTEAAEEEIDLTIPDGINDPVVQAVDYGICDTRLLAPSGTTFETQTSGIFAPNGTYYEPQAVDETYFDDALFVGDSRTDGLRIYGDMAQYTDFWCKDGMNVEVILTDTAAYYTNHPSGTIQSGNDYTLDEVLSNHSYRKIYVCIGINELGIPDTVKFYQQYQQLLQYLRQSQPDALLYIQGIMHVSAAYSQSDITFNNTNIVEKNTAIASLANGRDIIYLDMNDRVTDENGDLIAELSGDGVHLKASAYANWKEDLLSHAIVRGVADWPTAAAAAGSDGTTANLEGGTGKAESDISPETGYVVQ